MASFPASILPKALQQQKKLSELFTYKPLRKYNGLIGKIPMRADTTYVGIEIEIEKVNMKEGSFPSSWNIHEDGSLKDNGKEFVTIPIHSKFLEIELKRLFDNLKNYHFSNRCSVHVHLNVRDMTLEELKTFVLLYLIYERNLYAFSGNRWNNNFCIPLVFSSEGIKQWFQESTQMEEVLQRWCKYSGLNLSPIWGGESHKLGTIEFRQMEGTDDIKRILTWVNLIVSLKIASKQYTFKEICNGIEIMNTDSSYIELTRSIFKDNDKVLFDDPKFKKNIERGITFCKTIVSYFKEPEVQKPIEIKFNKKGEVSCVEL